MKSTTVPLGTAINVPPGSSLDSPIDVPIDVLAVGARSRLVWRSPQLTLAGIGVAARVAADEVLDLLGDGFDADSTLGVAEAAAAGPVAFGALPFDRSAVGEMVVPEIIVASSPDGQWITTVGDLSTDDALEQIAEVLALPVPAASEPTEITVRSVIAPETWRDEIVAEGVRRITAGEVDKVVLARELVVTSDHPIDQALVVSRLAAAFPSAMVFNIEGFVGASPELLVSRSGDVVQARPLAGTAPRGADPAADALLAEALQASAKNRGEHKITIDWFLKELLPFCSYVDAEPEPSLLTIANLHHLQTLVEGRLSSPPASVLELVKAVHPTPAVGGAPQGDALRIIGEIERAERGRYAGPTGWVDAAGNGEFAVSVRSAQMTDHETHLFAGVGVVADSDPQVELDETRIKFRALLGALLQP